jgi:oxygen-independent coproporphyrinogen-3 oxidase
MSKRSRQEVANLKAILPEGVESPGCTGAAARRRCCSPTMMRDLAAHDHDAMPLADGAEFSVEIDPNEIDEPGSTALAEAGMNRASIGVQDFDDDIQQAIGRIQGYEVTRDTVDMLRAHGIQS